MQRNFGIWVLLLKVKRYQCSFGWRKSDTANWDSFEYIKQQLYYSFLSHYYGHRRRYLRPFDAKSSDPITIIKPHWALEPMFILFAGASASFTSQAIFYPLNQIQNVHLSQLEGIDRDNARAAAGLQKHTHGWWRRYSHAYEETFKQC